MNKVREGYKITDLGVIPEAWSIKKLNNVFERITDKNKDNYSDNVLTISAQMGLVNQEEFFNKNIASKNTSNYYLLNRGDFAYNKSYSAGYPMGAIKRLNKYDKGIVSPLYICFRKKSELISGKFYEHFFEYTIFDNAIASIAQEGARNHGLLNVNIGDFFELPIIVPPIEEQEKIASILSTVDEQIDNVNALIEKNKELKKGLMQTLLTKGIGHTKFKKTEIGEIPDEWDVIKFFDFVDKIIDFRGRTPKKLGMDWGNGDIQALSANNVKMGKIDFSLECYLASEELYEKWMSGNELKNGDIIMTMEAPLGNVALVPDERKYILSQRVIALKTKDFINNKFMKYMLMSDGVQRQLETLSTGTTAKGINQKNLARVYVKIPMIKEQEKIASILFKIDEKIEEYENKKQKLEVIKKGLMQKLLTGEIRGI